MVKENYTKPALSYERQLDEKLIPRGLQIGDRERALNWLRRIGYYRLSGYLYPFRVSTTDDQFRPGSTFEAAIAIYKFDCRLRLLLLQAIDRIEIAMRASVTYHLAHDLGPFGHMNSGNFKTYIPATDTTEERGFDFAEFERTLTRAEKQSSEVFISHYRNGYTNEALPIWMLTEILSFGSLSKLTENLIDTEIQRKIARDFALSQSQLVSWLRCLCYVRNSCAHHARVWNRPLSIKPELLPKWRYDGVTRDRIYVVLLLFAHLLRQIAPESKWAIRISEHLRSGNNAGIDLSAMGAPNGWENNALWADERGPG